MDIADVVCPSCEKTIGTRPEKPITNDCADGLNAYEYNDYFKITHLPILKWSKTLMMESVP